MSPSTRRELAEQTRTRAQRALPTFGLLLALSTLFLFSGDRDRFYRSQVHDWASARALAEADNLSWSRQVFVQVKRRPNGTLWYELHQRFPMAGHVLVKLAIAPFGDDLSAQILSARMFMLAAFCAAAVLAYLALRRLTGSRSVAAGATLLAFSSYYLLRYSDMISGEGSPDLFAMLLVFHGMVVFEQERRTGQLVAKVCVALLLGWHVYALLLPFLALGLSAELWRERRRGFRASALAATLLRSRYLLVGVVALAVGVGTLAHNLQVEDAAFAGQREVADLPSFRSLLRRTGRMGANSIMAEATAWPSFLAGQFHRLGGMVIPYAGPIPRDDFGELPWAASEGPTLAWLGILATVATFGGLALVRSRRLLATLALSAFCWTLPMRYQTADPTHDYESLFLVGVPLVLYTVLLLGVAKAGGRRGRRVAAALAALAAVVFALSSRAMGEAGRDAESAAWERTLMSEFEAIRAVTRGKEVLVAIQQDAVYRFMKPVERLRVRRAYSSTLIDDSGRKIFAYFLAGAVMRYAEPLGEAAGDAHRVPADFVLAFERLPLPSLRTPEHRLVFLYDSADAITATLRARRRDYRTIASTEPVAAGAWNVHAGHWSGEPQLVYLRDRCRVPDTAGRFFLRVLPTTERAAPASRTLPNGYVQERLIFADTGISFDGKCMMRWAMPDYGVAAAQTGQYAPHRGPQLWRAAFYLDFAGLWRAYEQTRSGAPAVRGRFDVYLTAERLIYVRERCEQEDVESRLFLHYLPANTADLPRARRVYGFDNADFQFADRGAALHHPPSRGPSGRPGPSAPRPHSTACVATVPLPNYRVAQIRTGQLDRAGKETWRVEFDTTSQIP